MPAGVRISMVEPLFSASFYYLLIASCYIFLYFPVFFNTVFLLKVGNAFYPALGVVLVQHITEPSWNSTRDRAIMMNAEHLFCLPHHVRITETAVSLCVPSF